MSSQAPFPVVRIPLLLPVSLFALLLLPACTASAFAATHEEASTDQQMLSQLEQRAQQANPREQCFLYAELISSMTEMAGRQMLNGEPDKASATLKRVEHLAQLVHQGIAKDTKRLKNAEMLMHKTSQRLSGFVHAAAAEDRANLQTTLKQLDQVHDELLAQVFSH